MGQNGIVKLHAAGNARIPEPLIEIAAVDIKRDALLGCEHMPAVYQTKTARARESRGSEVNAAMVTWPGENAMKHCGHVQPAKGWVAQQGQKIRGRLFRGSVEPFFSAHTSQK